MKLDADNDTLIRRYLLANISEDERERVETRLMTDDDFFRQIDLVEDELIDRYLEGDLQSADRDRFENSFLCSHERRQKLRFARALHAYAAAHPVPAPKPEPWWYPIAAMLNPLRPVPVYSLVAALLVVAAGAPLAVRQIAALKGRVSDLQAQQKNSASLIEEQKAKMDQIAIQMQKEQDRRSKESAAGETTQIAMLIPPSFVLSPGMQRGLQSSRLVEIAANQALVRMKLDLPENPHATYKAVLSSEDQEIFTCSRLRAVETPDRITITLDLPTAGLSNGTYEIKLYGSGQQEPMESYVFQVTRKGF